MTFHIPPIRFLWIAAMSNGQGFEVKVPWWVQAIGVIGVTAAIALYLVFWVTNTVASQLYNTEREVHDTEVAVAEVEKAVQDSNAATAETNKNLANSLAIFRRSELRLLTQACVNSAKSPYQTAKCISSERENGEQ